MLLHLFQFYEIFLFGSCKWKGGLDVYYIYHSKRTKLPKYKYEGEWEKNESGAIMLPNFF